MADSIVVLRQRACRAEGCGALFFICRSWTGVRATAASPAVVCSAGSNAVRPTADTSYLPRAELIIATAKEPTVSASSKPA